ncbi:hypothetical protein M0804_010495 [Polistes exclamans]|nr:hypothetical protein M0804_010495 [Polistes exclamans]
MHHAYSSKKGDSLCPLGFHPQVRWPTRCKRCFRDYKDHGEKRGNLRDITSSTPNLSLHSSSERDGKRSWASTTNLTKNDLRSSNLDSSLNSVSTSNFSTSANQLNDVSELQKQNTAKDKRLSLIGEKSTSKSQLYDSTSKLQIKEVIKNNENTAGNDVEFIIQVKKSPTKTVSVNEIQRLENGVEESEIKKLRKDLNEMKEKCQRLEKEKSEILLRRLSTMDTISNKTSVSEVIKLEKSIKALTEEKSMLLSKIRDLENEARYKLNRRDTDKTSEDLKSKLKAAETLCESLMDENEDMKKEIRELEEEICEMQDNFREDQANEYTNLRKSLEQSNKNSRILSFKLRKLERTTEQLQKEKNDFEKRLQEVRKIEEMLTKINNDSKKRTDLKPTELGTKVQFKKTVDDMQKQIDNIITLFANINDGQKIDITCEKNNENIMKYDALLRDYELIKQKLEDTSKELIKEKEKEKGKGKDKEKDKDKDKDKHREGKITDDKMNMDFQNMKKKLDYTLTSRETEKKAWEEEKEKLKSELLSLSFEKLKIYKELEKLKKDTEAIRSSEKEYANKIKRLETTANDLKKELSQEKKKCTEIQNDLSSCTQREANMTETISNIEQTKNQLDKEAKHLKEELENLRRSSATQIANLKTELTNVKKDKDKLTAQIEKEKSTKESEIASLKSKITSLEKSGLDATKIKEMKANYSDKISKLTNQIEKMNVDYDKLNEKNKALVVLKEKIEEENQSVNSILLQYKTDLNNNQTEIQSLQDLIKEKENEWQLEKSSFEKRIQEYEALSHKPLINDLRTEINSLKKENDVMLKRLDNAREVNEDLVNKLKDYDAVSKAHQVLSADTTSLESEIQKLKTSLTNVEKAKKADIAQCKMHYEHRVTAISDEMQSLQNQLSRYKRERDTYKHMLEGAQRTIADLKLVRQRKQSYTNSEKSDEDEESSKANITVLEQQISCMEDELSETKLEYSRLKTSLVSEKSAWNVKLSEMQSRINELEEERILSSGRSKIPGIKVRMELAWQKERKEQQRLLEETATLARDLRQTLFEIERERSKERLENKRKQDQLKKAFDEEKEENKKKLIELQCDLLELRDAHAKLRTSNERMRREKERHEKERQDLKNEILRQRELDNTEVKNINMLLRQVDDLQRLFPELHDVHTPEKSEIYTPTPPRRLKGPKSRESSPMLDTKNDIKDKNGSMQHLENRTEKLEYTIKKLMDVAKELKESKKTLDNISAKQLMKLSKRSTSVDNTTRRGTSPNPSKPRLKVKSLSLEQTTGGGSIDSQNVWGTDSNMSSLQSLESNPRAFTSQRDSSVDSRLSGDSTKSEMLHREKKYNKGIIGKIRTKLVKSSSVDEASMNLDYRTSGSEISINEDVKEEKKKLKKKLSDMFKRGNRSSSTSKKSDGGDSSRPPSRNSTTSKT